MVPKVGDEMVAIIVSVPSTSVSSIIEMLAVPEVAPLGMEKLLT